VLSALNTRRERGLFISFLNCVYDHDH
jgi:hypothetical protein